MLCDMKFNSDYKENVALQNGSQICLRLINTNDKQHFITAFNNLSAESRYRRFMGSKKAITPNDLRYFTEIDQYNHFALGAFNLDTEQNETSLAGVTRIVRLLSDPECAEVGITVVDYSQRKGIGRHLIEHLGSAATERGIKRLRFECLSENLNVQHLVKKLHHDIKFIREDNLLIAQVEIPTQATNNNLYPLEFIDNLSALVLAFSSEAFIKYTDLSLKMFALSLNSGHGRIKLNDKKAASQSRIN